MQLLYSGLNGSGCDLNSRIHGCPVEEHSFDFGGNGNTPVPWTPFYRIVIVLLLSCYVVAIVVLVCCYCRVTVLLLRCYCVVMVLLWCCYVRRCACRSSPFTES